MTPRLFSISVVRGEDYNAALQKIFRETQFRGWTVWEPPQPLMTNYKVVRLVNMMNQNIICKVDGPGFIIDEIYQYFLKH